MSGLMLELVRPYKWRVAIIFCAMLVETGASLAAPWPLKVIIDNAIGKQALPGWLAPLFGTPLPDDRMVLAIAAAIGIVVIAGIGACASYIDNYFTESVGQWVANDLRMRMYHHLEHFSLSYYDKAQTATLLSTITDDISTIQDFASSSTLSILVDLLTICGMLALMLWLNFDFALIAIGVTPFLLLFVMRFKRAVKSATHEVRVKQSAIVAVVQQGLESMRVTEAFGREDLEEARLGEASQEEVGAALKARKIKSLLSPVISMVVAACTAVVVWRGAALILSGAMTIGALTVFLAYLSKFFSPVQDLAKMTNTIAQAAVGVERVRAILDLDMSIPERPDARDEGPKAGEIVFSNVAFGYDEDVPVLKDVSFTIKPGQLVGVVGPTGSGKSTVASLIPRLYDRQRGTVSIDGVDVADYKLQALRSQIGFVLQDTVLFRGSVRDNIAYGRPSATDEEVVWAAKLANADEFIVRMPHGYDTQVGERGLTLSGGQRQRIGIARAIIRNSPILILDEPTAALDTASEELVVSALDRLMKGRTAITIAHRLSTIRNSDKIIVLKDGVVAEEGTHDELIKLGGVYAELYHIQFGTGTPEGPAPAASAAAPA
ncbi:MAG TPA: ABC transporter ATP-binding protein [Stellaceae bacterium]|nr:ABC transporter ATP-binding protein [Stellaceae bacterium]